MKKWVLILLSISFFFVGCDVVSVNMENELFDMGTRENVFLYVTDNIHYSNEGIYHWQLPHVTIKTNKGNCVAYSLLEASGLIYAGDTDVKLVWLLSIKDPKWSHMIIRDQGVLREPQLKGQIYNLSDGVFIHREYTFQEALNEAPSWEGNTIR